MSEGNARRMTVERLNAATVEEQADILSGYGDASAGRPPPGFTSDFYDHGRQQGVADRSKEIDREQRRLAWELARLGRSSTEDEWAQECLRRGDIDGWKEASAKATEARWATIMAGLTPDQRARIPYPPTAG